jgi:hypothetical protein
MRNRNKRNMILGSARRWRFSLATAKLLGLPTPNIPEWDFGRYFRLPLLFSTPGAPGPKYAPHLKRDFSCCFWLPLLIAILDPLSVRRRALSHCQPFFGLPAPGSLNMRRIQHGAYSALQNRLPLLSLSRLFKPLSDKEPLVLC